MGHVTQSIAADRRRTRVRIAVIGGVVAVLAAAAVGVTVWNGATEEEPAASLCDELSLGGLGEFGEVDGGRIEETDDGAVRTCAGTYRGGTVTLTVTVQVFGSAEEASSAFAAVPSRDGVAGSRPEQGWDEARFEGTADSQAVLRRGSTLAVVLLDLPMEVTPADLNAAWNSVTWTASRLSGALKG